MLSAIKTSSRMVLSPAGLPHGFFRKGRECPIARGILIREHFARTTEQHGGARLALGDLDRRQLGAVYLLEIDELAGRSHDRERHRRIVFLGLRKRGGRNRLCLLIGDGRAVVGGRRRGRERLARQWRDTERPPRGPD